MQRLRSAGTQPRHSSASAPNTPTSFPPKTTPPWPPKTTASATSPCCSSAHRPQSPKSPLVSAPKRPFAAPKSSPPPDGSPPPSPTRSTTPSKPSPTQSISLALPPNPRFRLYLKIADEELSRVAQITKQTLGFYRENAPPGIVKLSVLLDDLLGLYKRKLQAKNLTVTKQYRGELEIWGSEGELRQVFANQIANAIYAMPHGGSPHHTDPNIEILAATASAPGTSVSLVDNGSGISPESLHQNLRPLLHHQARTSATASASGSPTTSSPATAARIRVRSNTRPGASGTIFTTFLPHHHAE